LGEWVLLAAMAGAAGLVQGLTGLGYSLVLVSLLVLAGGDVLSASITATVTCLFCQATIIYRLRSRFSFPAFWPVALGALIAVPAGVLLIAEFHEAAWLQRGFGVFVAAVAIWLLVAPRRPHVTPKPQRLLGVGAGLLSGLAGGLFNTGGPPAALYVYSRPIQLDIAKVTLQWLFTGMAAYRLAAASAQGLVSSRLVLSGLRAAPLVVLGAFLGVKLAARIRPERLRKIVYLLLVLIGLKLCLFP